MTRQASARLGATGVPPGRRSPGTVDQQQLGRARLVVLHDVHVTIVNPHEPAAGAPIAGHVLYHCAISRHLP